MPHPVLSRRDQELLRYLAKRLIRRVPGEGCEPLKLHEYGSPEWTHAFEQWLVRRHGLHRYLTAFLGEPGLLPEHVGVRVRALKAMTRCYLDDQPRERVAEELQCSVRQLDYYLRLVLDWLVERIADGLEEELPAWAEGLKPHDQT